MGASISRQFSPHLAITLPVGRCDSPLRQQLGSSSSIAILCPLRQGKGGGAVGELFLSNDRQIPHGCGRKAST